MAYLTFAATEDNQNNCFKFIGANPTNNTVSLITGEAIGKTSLLSTTNNNSIMDTCSFYSGPTDSTIVAFGDKNWESCGSIAYSNSETCGIAGYSAGSESCGSIATTVSSGSSFSGGCSYSC